MKKVNLVEILRACPKGMELDCTICNGVKFRELDRNPNFPIVVRANNDYEFTLTKYGQVHNIDESKCVIFPKGKDTWDGFVPPVKFKDGDIVAYDNASSPSTVFIYRNDNPNWNTSYFVGLTGLTGTFFKEPSGALMGYNPNVRFATKEEKERLFKAIKDNGYKWNAETKTLERIIKPKFKVGDKVRVKNGVSKYRIIDGVFDNFYSLQFFGRIDFTEQDRWELVPNKFDLNTLKPFESRVLVRYSSVGYWLPAFWGVYMHHEGYKGRKFLTTQGFAHYCIPYEGNEHLVGSKADCDEFYKTWEE